MSPEYMVLGRSADLETGFSATANEFSDTIAWDIREASDQEIQTWEDAAEILIHGSGTLTLYADAVEKYRQEAFRETGGPAPAGGGRSGRKRREESA
ncbi:hypothetical protein HNR06_000012 [Nocardiopsis arvandica]|uniref:Uncharacterized protein n=1 Tax=Nocardiopsis sinuspersici TaxID=501010 RepID=A0A7Y9X7I9_9ACTN|nr:hypothetical protein [Nocardiopsis sinuspersici]NYH50423.1 hypothetical protein [Nocardiopsis sinuspersici]